MLAAWNGLMLAAFAEAARALNRDDYRQVAEHNAKFLLGELRQENGQLLRTWKQGEARLNGYLEDYAYVGDPDSADTQALLNVVHSGYRPFQVVALGAPDGQRPAVPLLQDHGPVDGQTAAYICRDFACQAPATEPAALRQLLEQQ